MASVDVKEFFMQRFGRSPESDQLYFEEWKERFATGHPEDYMDSKSLAVYKSLGGDVHENSNSQLNLAEDKLNKGRELYGSKINDKTTEIKTLAKEAWEYYRKMNIVPAKNDIDDYITLELQEKYPNLSWGEIRDEIEKVLE